MCLWLPECVQPHKGGKCVSYNVYVQTQFTAKMCVIIAQCVCAWIVTYSSLWLMNWVTVAADVTIHQVTAISQSRATSATVITLTWNGRHICSELCGDTFFLLVFIAHL